MRIECATGYSDSYEMSSKLYFPVVRRDQDFTDIVSPERIA